MRLAGFKVFMNHLLDRLGIDSHVFTQYIIGLLEAQNDIDTVSAISQWLDDSTNMTASNGISHHVIAEDIRKKYIGIRGADSDDDDDDDDVCIEDCLRERGPDIYHTDLGLEDDEGYDQGINCCNVNGSDIDYSNNWSISQQNNWDEFYDEDQQEGYLNRWDGENDTYWTESTEFNHPQYDSEGTPNYSADINQSYGYEFSENHAYDYTLETGVDDGTNDAVALAINVKERLQLLCPFIVFSTEAICSVLYDCAGDFEQAAENIQSAYNVATACKPCRHMMTGKCYKRDCAFEHDVAGVTCRFWLLDPGCAALSIQDGGTCQFQHRIFPLAESRETEIEAVYRTVSEYERDSIRTDICSGQYPALSPSTVSSHPNCSNSSSRGEKYVSALKKGTAPRKGIT